MSDFFVKTKENAVTLMTETKKVSYMSVIAFIIFQLWDFLSNKLFAAMCENFQYFCDVENAKWYGSLSLVIGLVWRFFK